MDFDVETETARDPRSIRFWCSPEESAARKVRRRSGHRQPYTMVQIAGV
jgi:ribosomal protein L21